MVGILTHDGIYLVAPRLAGGRRHRPRGGPLPLVPLALRDRRARHPGTVGCSPASPVLRPYRWVRNPIYVAALLVVVGEAWLFLSLPLLLYAGALAVGVHLFVVGYEEPTLRRRFGDEYAAYQQRVRRWVPRPPRPNSA